MTIDQLREIQVLLEKRKRLDSKIKSLNKCLVIRIDVPCGCDPIMLTKEKPYKEDVEAFNAMVVSGANKLQEVRDKVTARLKELGLEE